MYDFCVIGGGIVGLATSWSLLQEHRGASLLLLEKEEQLAAHQTGHNSGVIHSGIYYEPGSLKARLSRQGEALTKSFCKEYGIPVQECGKLLVATSATEIGRMEALRGRAAVHGIEVERLGSQELASMEPNVCGMGALLVPHTAIVDYRQVAGRLAGLVNDLGGTIRTGERVNAIRESSCAVSISTAHGSYASRRLVVAGGLQADRLAAAAGLLPDVRIVPFRGEYFRLAESLGQFVRHLIYPVPDPALPFLGVHLSPTVNGDITAGPNAVLSMAREGYNKHSLSPRDLADYLTYRGFWAMAKRNVGTGLREVRNSLFKRCYLDACRRYAPALEITDLLPYPAGIRAQAVTANGTLVHDFALIQTTRTLHLLNAPSPAATSALAIGRELTVRLRRGA